MALDVDSTGTDEWKHTVSESKAHPVLQAFLADRDVPCPHCGYNLRGLQAPVCPECKHDLQLKLDGDFAAMRYLPMLYWLVGCMMLTALLTIIMTAGYWSTDSTWSSITQVLIYYGLPLVIAIIEFAACIFVWRRVRSARRSGMFVIRAYIVCLAAVLLVSAVHLAQWIAQLVIGWTLW